MYIFYIIETPLKNVFLEIIFFLHIFCLKIFTLSKFHSHSVEMSKIFEKKQQKNEKDIFLTLDHMGIPFENQKVKNRTSSCLPKLGLEPKFNETGTFGGFGKSAQSLSDIQLGCVMF